MKSEVRSTKSEVCRSGNPIALIFIFALMFTSSCARSPSMDVLHFWGNAYPKEDTERCQAYIAEHADLSEEHCRMILDGQLWKGMSKDEAIASRGLPHDIWRNFSDDKNLEKWIYRYHYYFPENFLVFDRHALVDWQEGWKHKES